MPLAILLLAAPSQASGQTAVHHSDETQHTIVGGGVLIYPTTGGFGWSDQSFGFTGAMIQAVRLGFSQIVSDGFRMELGLFLGTALVTDPGFRIAGNQRGHTAAFSWGAGLSGHYRFPVGFTLGVGLELNLFNGSQIGTSVFRVAPAFGWEIHGPAREWLVHLRWVTGITVIQGLSEENSDPASNLTTTGFEVVYGF
ncbi:MAG: hypothetical protein KC561_21015 [Myxococcales bacterium]|nr:hypothetical protein [Myxococcales bacterium]